MKFTEVYDLNKDQQKAFNSLKRVANKCVKLKIGFVNLYGHITAFDKNMIAGFDVDADYELSCKEYGYPSNYIDNLGGDSYADDQSLHSFKLTPKGKKVFNSELS